MAIVDRDGADALSIRALAGELSVTPMALYNHVADKRDLLVSVAKRMLADARFDHGDGEWRARLCACFRTLRALCLRHPGAVRLMEIEGVAPAGVFGPLEVTLDALRDAGLEPMHAMYAYHTLMGFTLAQASYEARGPISDLDPASALDANRLADPAARMVGEALPPTASWDFDRAFEYGLSLILDGIERSVQR